MQVTVENPGGLQRRLTVQVPAEEVQDQIDARLREIGKTARLQGFRPGRIPMSVLKQRFGPSVRNEVLSRTMESNLMQAIQQESLQLASNPVIENMGENKAGEPFEFTASIEVFPEIGDVDVSSLAINKPDTEVTDSDIDDMLQTLREQRGAWEAVTRTPEDGDQVLIEYAAETKEGRIPEEGMDRLAVIMGQSGFDKLEKTLSGLVAGGVSDSKLTFPDDFNVAALAGHKAKVTLKVDSVREMQLPELDEEFIKSFAIDSGDLEDMRKEVRNNLERELQGARLTYMKTQLLKELLEAHEGLEVPDAMVREEATQLQSMEARQRGQEADPEAADQYMDIARRRVKSGLLISEIAKQNDILVDGARVREAIETVASTYEQSQEVVNMYYQNQEMLRAIEGSVLEEQVVDWAIENAKVSDESLAFKDLINAAAASRQGL